MSKSTISRPIETRLPFVEAFPHLRQAHVQAQRAMFNAAKAMGLSTKPEARDEMLEGINSALKLRGSKRLISRRQMNIDEMHAIAIAIECGLFGDSWEWGEEFEVTVRPMAMEMNVVHFEPCNLRRDTWRVPVYSADEWDENGDA